MPHLAEPFGGSTSTQDGLAEGWQVTCARLQRAVRVDEAWDYSPGARVPLQGRGKLIHGAARKLDIRVADDDSVSLVRQGGPWLGPGKAHHPAVGDQAQLGIDPRDRFCTAVVGRVVDDDGLDQTERRMVLQRRQRPEQSIPRVPVHHDDQTSIVRVLLLLSPLVLPRRDDAGGDLGAGSGRARCGEEAGLGWADDDRNSDTCHDATPPPT